MILLAAVALPMNYTQGNWSIPINIAYYYDKFKTHYDEEERHIIDDNDSINNNN